MLQLYPGFHVFYNNEQKTSMFGIEVEICFPQSPLEYVDVVVMHLAAETFRGVFCPMKYKDKENRQSHTIDGVI